MEAHVAFHLYASIYMLQPDIAFFTGTDRNIALRTLQLFHTKHLPCMLQISFPALLVLVLSIIRLDITASNPSKL